MYILVTFHQSLDRLYRKVAGGTVFDRRVQAVEPPSWDIIAPPFTGHEPDKRFSGQIPLMAFFSQRVIMLRVSPDVHRAANAIAKSEGKSLNAWIAETVERAV